MIEKYSKSQWIVNVRELIQELSTILQQSEDLDYRNMDTMQVVLWRANQQKENDNNTIFTDDIEHVYEQAKVVYDLFLDSWDNYMNWWLNKHNPLYLKQ